MWRPAHGATSRPGPCRPESGYGRELGRPGPVLIDLAYEHAHAPLDPGLFGEPTGQGWVPDPDTEAPSPVTP